MQPVAARQRALFDGSALAAAPSGVSAQTAGNMDLRRTGMNYLEDYYNTHDEDSRLLSQHGQIEYLTTMKYIHEYLSGVSGARVLEVGAGTGRYSVALAKDGYNVTAVELVAHNLDILRSKLDGTEPITVLQGNALDLSALPDGKFDLTMLLGPMYHLYTREESCRLFRKPCA